MISTIPALLAIALSAAPDIGVTAKLTATKFRVGREYDIVLSLDLPKSVNTGSAGVPSPLLQIQAPDCIRLSGKHLTTHKELSRNEFLQAPYERLLEKPTATVRFTLVSEPGPDDRIGLNVIAYISSGTDLRFVRKRLELPVKLGAIAEEVDSTNSQWGAEELLQIGSQAADFELPILAGGTASLSEYRGKKNILITTYRAYW